MDTLGFSGFPIAADNPKYLHIFNTAIEYLTDLASPDFHPLAGKAKDTAAGAVLIASFGAFFIGVIIFIPKIASYF